MQDYTLVVGVDRKHLYQLSHTWPTWRKHKPSLLNVPMVAFYDAQQLECSDVVGVIDHPLLRTVPWTPEVERYGTGGDKWSNPQRAKMLAGFVHVPPEHVLSRYWLKLDTDVVATGTDDWIDDGWFEGAPAIVSQRWTFTKPADQMLKLDEWASKEELNWTFGNTSPLNLAPVPGSGRVSHPRIISWCGFFNTMFTQWCSSLAVATTGKGMLPVPSQDGFLWYVAARLDLGIERKNFKKLGWEHWSTMENIVNRSEAAMRC